MPLAIVLAAPMILGAKAPTSFEAVVESVQKDVQAGRPSEALKTLDSVIKRERNKSSVALLQTFRGLVLIDLGRRPEGMAALDTAIGDAPELSLIPLTIFHAGRGIADVDLTMKGLDRLIDAFPEIIQGFDYIDLLGVLEPVRNKLGDAAADNLNRRLADVGFGGDRPSDRDSMALSGIDEYLKVNDVEHARVLAARIEDRDALVTLLTVRKYQVLWPEVEARVGPHLEAPTTAALMTAERVFASDNSSLSARSELMTTYSNVGRLADAERIGAGFATDETAVRALDQRGGWLVNQHAGLLRAMGRYKEADARYASLRVNNIADKPWLISMIINRAQSAMIFGQNAEAERLLIELDGFIPRYTSPYAVQLYRRMKLCLAYEAGRNAEGEALLAELKANRARASEGVFLEGLLCAGRDDEAAALLIETLANPAIQEAMIGQLQPKEAFFASPTYNWRGSISRIADRPDVQAAFLRVGRPLPRAYWAQ